MEEKQAKLLFDDYSKHMPPTYEGFLYHYTSNDAYQKILFSSGNIELWASRYDCLNDASEGSLVLPLYKEVCKKMKSKNLISEELYNFLNQITPEEKEFFMFQKGKGYYGKECEYDTYVCSFSKNKDSLAMWNYYSKDNKYGGYSIGINNDLSYVLNKYDANIYLFKVIYNKQAQEKLIENFILDFKDLDFKKCDLIIKYHIRTYLSRLSLLFKHNCFQHEDEVRAVIRIPKKTIQGSKKQPFITKYRTSNGILIPYIVLEFPKELLCEIMIGPLRVQEKHDIQLSVHKQQLMENDYLNVTVNFSSIPIRY